MTERQNLYDNPEFFAGYSSLRQKVNTVHDLLIEPTLRGMLPPVNGKRVLDFGCGAGDNVVWLAEHGAKSVTGVDVSELMLGEARRKAADVSIPESAVRFVRSAAEDADFPDHSFDLVLSSLLFHYVADLRAVFGRIRRWMSVGAALTFVMEHPMFTAAQGRAGGQWEKDESGNLVAWRVDNYLDEGPRTSHWIVDGVVRQHHSLATIINGLIDAGFLVTRVVEPRPTEAARRANPELDEERRAPAFLFISAKAD